MDAIADIASVCLLLHKLAPDQIIASPIHVGSGQVKCAHGTPAGACTTATAYILKDIPIYSGSIPGELCTPTGAALLKHFVTRFDQMPLMTPASTGYGMGTKDFPAANCVRAILGEGFAENRGRNHLRTLMQRGRHDRRRHRLCHRNLPAKRCTGRFHRPHAP